MPELAAHQRLASTNSRLSAWVAVALALACAFGLRHVGAFAADHLDEPQGILSHIVFAGVALLAAGLAGMVGRVWATPAATIVLGVSAGLLATRYEDSVPGAALGLIVGLVMATTLAWQLTQWSLGHLWGVGRTIGFGALTGAGVGASWMVGGWLGPARAAGVAVASYLVYLALRSETPTDSDQLPSDVPARVAAVHVPVRRRLGWLGFVGGFVGGMWWLSEPLWRLAAG